MTEEHQRQVATFIRNVTDVPSVEVETFCASARRRRYAKGVDFVRSGERCTETLFIHRGAFRHYLLVTRSALSNIILDVIYHPILTWTSLQIPRVWSFE